MGGSGRVARSHPTKMRRDQFRVVTMGSIKCTNDFIDMGSGRVARSHPTKMRRDQFRVVTMGSIKCTNDFIDMGSGRVVRSHPTTMRRDQVRVVTRRSATGCEYVTLSDGMRVRSKEPLSASH